MYQRRFSFFIVSIFFLSIFSNFTLQSSSVSSENSNSGLGWRKALSFIGLNSCFCKKPAIDFPLTDQHIILVRHAHGEEQDDQNRQQVDVGWFRYNSTRHVLEGFLDGKRVVLNIPKRSQVFFNNIYMKAQSKGVKCYFEYSTREYLNKNIVD